MKTDPARVLIAYDGSAESKAAIDSLAVAGLPVAVKARILTSADVWLPQGGAPVDPKVSLVFPAVLKARRQALAALAAAKDTARQGAKRLAARFPRWRIEATAAAEAPVWAVMHEAEAWSPHLVVVGSRGRSAVARVLLGSVSQRVMGVCGASVRIGRRRAGRGPLKIMVAVDGSLGALAALREAASRRWPRGTRFLVAAVLDDRLITEAQAYHARRWMARVDRGQEWVRRMVDAMAGQMGENEARAEILDGPAVKAIVSRAARWGADAVFVGARGLSPIRRALLGGVSMGVAAQAPCSVEVVRGRS